MKFSFKQLGPLYEGQVDLADLTIICGENNTGKTYITNSLYALFSSWQQLLAWDLSEKDLLKLQSEGFISIDLQKEIVDNWDVILQNTMAKLANNLHDFLATPPERFKNTKLFLSMPITNDWIDRNVEGELKSSQGKLLVSIKKTSGQHCAEIAVIIEAGEELPPIHSLSRFIREQLLEIVLEETFSKAFIASAERTGAAIFQGELNFSKNKLVKILTEMDNDEKSVVTFTKMLKVMQRTYALSIDHNVEFINIEIRNL